MQKTTKIKLIALFAALAVVGGGLAAVVATAPANGPNLANKKSFVATTMETSILIVDAATGTAVTQHGHGQDGSPEGFSIAYEAESLFESFSVSDSDSFLYPALHSANAKGDGECNHGYYPLKHDPKSKPECVWDGYHGTVCTKIPSERDFYQENACRKRIVDGTIYKLPAPEPCGNSYVPGVTCDNAGGGGSSGGAAPPVSGIFKECVNKPGLYCFEAKGAVVAEAKNLADDINVEFSISSSSRHAALKPQSRSASIASSGGEAKASFLFQDVPAGELAGLTLRIVARATSVDLEGHDVEAEADAPITIDLPSGNLVIRIEPMTVSGTAWTPSGDASHWSERRVARSTIREG